MNPLILNHDGVKLHECFNIEPDRAKRLYSIMFYETISTFIIAGDMFDDPFEDSPRELVTKSGKLERCLTRVSDSQEKYFMLASYFIESTKIEHVLEKYAKSNLINKVAQRESSTSEIPDAVKDLIMDLLKNLGNEIFKDLAKIIEVIKISNNDFNIFLAMLDQDDPDAYIQNAVDSIIHMGDKKNSSDE